MAKITLKGSAINTAGELPAVGADAPDFTFVKNDLSEGTLHGVAGVKVLNIFPSIDTGVCADSVREFNKRAAEGGLTVLNVSADLPFAQKRFCGAEGIAKAETVSVFRGDFFAKYKVAISDGPLKGLASRCVLVVDAGNKVVHAEQVPEIAQEPNYDAALKALA